MKAQIITIGNELLIGQVVDTNSAWLGENLTALGVQVDRIISIADEEKVIIDQLNVSSREVDLVIVSGGLGPTKDDITKSSIAAFLGVDMVYNHDAYESILRYLEKHGRKPVDAIFHHAHFPEGTVFLQNDLGTAPGMVFRKNDCVIISVPGVPYEMKFIMENEGFELIRALNPGSHIIQKTLLTVGEFEARLSDRIKDIVEQLPAHFSIAFLPNLNQVRLRLNAAGNDPELLQRQMDEQCRKIETRLGQHVFGYGKQSLAEVVGQILLKHKLTVSTAESCTGGYLSHLITSIPGSSAYYCGSVISYSNEIKERVLGVHAETLKKQGAVSEETVIEMVKGALKIIKTDLAIAISGVAGPDGGTEEKPVGTIWMACGNRNKTVTKKIQLGKDRIKNIESGAIHALDLLRLFLLKEFNPGDE